MQRGRNKQNYQHKIQENRTNPAVLSLRHIGWWNSTLSLFHISIPFITHLVMLWCQHLLWCQPSLQEGWSAWTETFIYCKKDWGVPGWKRQRCFTLVKLCKQVVTLQQQRAGQKETHFNSVLGMTLNESTKIRKELKPSPFKWHCSQRYQSIALN